MAAAPDEFDEWAPGAIGAHECTVCSKLVPDTQLTCNEHWVLVPRGLQALLRETADDEMRYAFALQAVGVHLHKRFPK